jgi:Fur family ferric uptake transcriptional regulator
MIATMATEEQQLKQTLKQHGQSMTTARQTVFRALQHQEPQSMHELIARVSAIDRASVYRTVAVFERLGIVQRLQTGWKYKLELSDTFHEHHHHATCLVCGRSLPLTANPRLEQQLHAIAAQHGFVLERHQIELQGRCAACASISN